MIAIRPLEGADFDRLHEIDLSEHITLIYKLDNGQLLPEAHDWQRPHGDASFWQHQMDGWRRALKPDVWLGAFASDQMVGLASLRHRLAPNLAQLTTLHVSQPYRRQGVACQLLDTVIELAQQSGAESLYVSATPSASAVGFYRSQGFEPTTEPNPEMYELEPDDIHMVRLLSSD